MKRSSSQARSPGSRSVGLDDGDPGLAELAGAARSQVTCWSRISLPARWLIASSCCAGVSPSWLGVVDAGEHLAFEAGDADHVEFVEVVGRDRQEAQPLEQRMARVVGLGEHALVEGQPGQLAIDEPLRRASIDGFVASGILLRHDIGSILRREHRVYNGRYERCHCSVN